MTTVDDTDNGGFLSRWSRRKAQARSGEAVAGEAQPQTKPRPRPLLDPVSPATAAQGTALTPPATEPDKGALQANDPVAVPTAKPAPTLADVEELTPDSDYSAFVARSVTPDVRNAALKKLFSDPHFNVMDGLDTYIGDYNTPDPLPPGMLRKMVQSQLLGLFDDDEKPDAPQDTPQAPPQTTPPADENPAVQLQPDDDARCPPAEPGAGPDAALQH